MMHVNDATNEPDASNSAENAPSSETSKKSEKKLKLRCDPQSLPKSPVPPVKLPNEEELSYDVKYAVKNFFCDRQRKANRKARDRGWI